MFGRVCQSQKVCTLFARNEKFVVEELLEHIIFVSFKFSRIDLIEDLK